MSFVTRALIWLMIGIAFLFHALMAYSSRKKDIEGFVKRAFLTKGIEVDDMTLQRCAEECDVPRVRYNLFARDPNRLGKYPWYIKMYNVFRIVMLFMLGLFIIGLLNIKHFGSNDPKPPHYYQYKELTNDPEPNYDSVILFTNVCTSRVDPNQTNCVPNTGKRYYAILTIDYSLGAYSFALVPNEDELKARENKSYLDDGPIDKVASKVGQYLTRLVTTKVEKQKDHYQISFNLNLNQDIINWMNQEDIGVSVSLVGTNGTVAPITDGISFAKEVEYEEQSRRDKSITFPVRQYVIGDQVMINHLDSDISLDITNTQYYPNLYRFVLFIIFSILLCYIWLVLRDYRIQGLIYKKQLIYLLEQRYNVEITEDLQDNV